MFTAEELLIPISDSNPSGSDVSFSPELDAIAQARKFDDPSLEQGEWVTDLKEADWDFVIRQCTTLLTKKTKDLKVAVWLTEAAAKQYRVRGLGEGFRLLAGLCEQYWDLGLYPEAEGGDQDQRIGNISWILSRTRALVREVPLTEGRQAAWSTIAFEAARKRAAAGNEPEGLPKLADMEAARRNNAAQFVATFHADAQYCLDALQKLEAVADAKLGADSPGFAAARDAVKGMLHALPVSAAAAPSAAQPALPDPDAAPGGQAAPVAQETSTPGPLRTRAQAIAQLRAVATFFRETEPHSPVSYFAEKAANAGEQDLHTWLRSVVKDQASLSHIEELLGVPPSN
ncbi:type VI secretion system protein ImpA [Pseudoduganella lurida]|uniref:Type VI secretion system protein ImpA n=1 Tax=Pseudoduganella lurida TaxID=1036180 RepID=A0A562RJL4_9BURK|nr:type VI secretion system protein TssA [Pseudoduganella lurida]TWI69211.1 type VI secretion system protein ImpA [Pseudoduganella lurida]